MKTSKQRAMTNNSTIMHIIHIVLCSSAVFIPPSGWQTGIMFSTYPFVRPSVRQLRNIFLDRFGSSSFLCLRQSRYDILDWSLRFVPRYQTSEHIL